MIKTFITLLLAIVALFALGCEPQNPADPYTPPDEILVYLADKMNNLVICYDYDGEHQVRTPDVVRPTDLDIREGIDHLWVADYSNDRVLKLNYGLNSLAWSAAGVVNDPYTVTTTTDAGCWVADRVNLGFVRFDTDAKEVARVTCSGPTRLVAWDSVNELCWAADENGNLFAFPDSLTGDYDATAATVTVTGLGTPRGLVVDSDNGRVWYSSKDADRVICFDTGGTQLFVVEDLDDPRGLAIDENGDCWVALYAGRAAVLLDGDDGAEKERFDNLNGPVDVAANPGGGVWVVDESEGLLLRLRNGVEELRLDGFTQPSAVALYNPK